ncbi:MAG TPA: hypothetical protein PK095_23980 [Myxococcota bacterium]|nr:hypothetical protein [Myxococcota bacterium]
MEVHGVRVAELVWDADEVLWDWAMSGARLFAQLPLAVLGNLGHREWVAVRPGLLELLWGMRHASQDLGLDPDLRVWTSGYPWRLWAIFREVPGFAELLGDGHPDSHPRVLTRPDYVAVVKPLVADEGLRRRHLDTMSTAARQTIDRQLAEKPHDSGFKIPELAVLAGRAAFATAKILIDDAGRNVRWFHATGRSAVRVRSVTPRLFGRIPNCDWTPHRFLREVASPAAFEIADALERLYRDPTPRIEVARVTPDPKVPPTPPVVIDVPSHVLWSQWIHPMRELERVFQNTQNTRKKAR